MGPGDAAGVPRPFEPFAAEVRAQGALRERITAACRRSEPDCLPALLAAARLPPAAAAAAEARARKLVIALRRKKATSGGVEGLIQEYSLSSQEGVALMCLAEALLRIPDAPTRDALIRDKISTADWQAHVGNSTRTSTRKTGAPNDAAKRPQLLKRHHHHCAQLAGSSAALNWSMNTATSKISVTL